MDKLYTIQEVAAKLNLSDKTLRRWEEAGRFLSSRTLGNQRRYSIEDLQILDAIKHGTIDGQSDLLTIHQAAKVCGVTPTTILRWENDGKIHPFITSHNTYYQRSRLIEKMEELKQQEPVSEPTRFEPEPTFEPIPEPQRVEKPIPEREIYSETPVESPIPKLTPLTNLTSTTKNNFIPFYTSNSTVSSIQPLLLNIAITLVLIVSYHLIFNTPAKLNSPQQTGSVKGVSTVADPTLDLLRTVLDPSGALTTTTLTSRVGLISPALSLTPTSSPTTPTPGTIYYDATSQSLKIFKGTGWVDLAPTYSFKVNDANLISGSAVLHKGKNQISVTEEKITPNTPLTITFNNDYAPAKKYWVTPAQGSFTLYTDFPVSADSPFSYNFITPSSTTSATPKP